LKPEAAEAVKKHGEITLTGVAYPTPANQCWPGGVPFIFSALGMQMLQQPGKITLLYPFNEFRQVRMNQPHPALATPRWYGDSVGHYEGDTLVIDTVGIKIGPFAMVDMFGTPHTEASMWWNDIGSSITPPRKKPGTGTRISASPVEITMVDRKLILPIWARGYSSNLRSRMQAFSQCLGRRPLLIGAG
jgi:hypothetical protein